MAYNQKQKERSGQPNPGKGCGKSCIDCDDTIINQTNESADSGNPDNHMLPPSFRYSLLRSRSNVSASTPKSTYNVCFGCGALS